MLSPVIKGCSTLGYSTASPTNIRQGLKGKFNNQGQTLKLIINIHELHLLNVS
jgi:hypothetical protein